MVSMKEYLEQKWKVCLLPKQTEELLQNFYLSLLLWVAYLLLNTEKGVMKADREKEHVRCGEYQAHFIHC